MFTIRTDVTNGTITIDDLRMEADGNYYADSNGNPTISFTVNPDDNYTIADSYPAEGNESSAPLPNPHVKVYDGDEVLIITPTFEDGKYSFDMPDNDICICVYCEEDQTPSDGIPRYIITDVQNGSITFTSNNVSVDEDDFYYTASGRTVFFSLTPESSDFQLAPFYKPWSEDGNSEQYDNPVVVTRDEDAEITGTIELTYNEETELYSFTMPDENVLIVAHYIDPENPPVNEGDSLIFGLPDTGEFEVYLLTPDESGEGYTATQLTPNEYGFVYVQAGDLISFSVTAPEGSSIPGEAHIWIDDENTATINNPCLFQFDEEFTPVYLSDALTYDAESGTYSFVMPDENTYLFVNFLDSEDNDLIVGLSYGGVAEYVVSVLTPNESGDGYIATKVTPDENYWCHVNEGDLISVSAIVPDDYELDSEVRILVGDDTLTFPNPCILSHAEEIPQIAAELVYDEETDSYIFTMPGESVYLYMDFVEPEVYGIGLAPYQGTITIEGITPTEDGFYYAAPEDEVFFSLTPDEGCTLGDSYNMEFEGKAQEFSNPVIFLFDMETFDFVDYLTPDYDEKTGLYSFSMPSTMVSIHVEFIGGQGTPETTDPDDEKLFIGRNPGEGGTIEFIDNESWSADEGDKVLFKVIPDKGYVINEVLLIQARYLEDGTIEPIDGKYLNLIQKNDDGSYTFTMPGSPVQIIATFKPLYNPDSTKLSYTKGSKKSVVITIKRAVDDPSCYTHFAGKVTIGGKELKRGENYTDASGSTVITLVPDYLETLANGDQDVVITFDDGEVTLPLSIAAAAATTDGNTTNNSTAPTASESPATGDTGNLTLWIALMALAGAGMFGTAVLRKKNECANR
ncbi:MAG: LPXTG cell wall anchor domain-containing protein [Lachnospiraceae bacterium]|nr:LPXTG cell wall anchor domain-containing protein [Lachnospiraceae bacterium]